MRGVLAPFDGAYGSPREVKHLDERDEYTYANYSGSAGVAEGALIAKSSHPRAGPVRRLCRLELDFSNDRLPTRGGFAAVRNV
jgi:hypothetical protein